MIKYWVVFQASITDMSIQSVDQPAKPPTLRNFLGAMGIVRGGPIADFPDVFQVAAAVAQQIAIDNKILINQVGVAVLSWQRLENLIELGDVRPFGKAN